MNLISKVEPLISKFLQYRSFLVNFNIEASSNSDSESILKVVSRYTILKQPSILKASISKTFDIGGGKVPDDLPAQVSHAYI